MGKMDMLRGFKENVIMGHIIPAGTGYSKHRHVELKPLVEPIPLEEPDLIAALEEPPPLAG
jgi:DNA-directed RNA polymerase subunit beta'